MTTNMPDLPLWESDEHPSLYRKFWKPHEEQIKILSTKILEELQDQELNPWARLEILDRVTKQIVEGLGTTVEPEVDVAAEDDRLLELYNEIRENAGVAELVLALIRSPGYKLGKKSIDEIWELVRELYYAF